MRTLTLMLPGIAALFLLAQCNFLASEPSPKQELDLGGVASGACLQGFSSQLERYVQGKMNVSEWSNTCDCVIQSLELFKDFVRSSDTQGYTVLDMVSFIKNYLIKNTPVSVEFVERLFQFKAFMMGGSTRVFSFYEIDQVIFLLKELKGTTLEMLPILGQVSGQENHPDTLFKFSKKLIDFGKKLSGFVSRWQTYHQGVRPRATENVWTQDQIVSFLNEAKDFLGESALRRALEYVRPGLILKSFFWGGAQNQVEARLLPSLIEDLFDLLGIASSALKVSPELTGPNARGEFYTDLLLRLKPHLLRIFTLRPARTLLFSDIKLLIDAIPQADFKYDKVLVKKVLRPIVSKLLWESATTGVSRKSLDTLYALLESCNRGQTHLETIFQNFHLDPEGVTRKEFLEAAGRYQEQLTGGRTSVPDVQRLMKLAERFKPMFRQGDNQIDFNWLKKHSLHHLTLFHLMRTASEHFMKSYGKGGETGKAELKDFELFNREVGEVGILTKIFIPTIPQLIVKNFKYMNFFTDYSNGDEFVDADELTYFLAFLVSAKTLSQRMREVIEPVCSTGKADAIQWQWMDAPCFRREMFGRLDSFWDHVPSLHRFYKTLNDVDRKFFQQAIEVPSRVYGYSEQPYGSFDSDAVAVIPQFLESLLQRLDKGGDGHLNLEEAMTGFPLFRTTLAEYGKIDPNDKDLLEAAYTYVIKYEKAPETQPPGVLHFLWWKANKNQWKSIDAGRMTIYKVFAVLAQPEPLPK